MSPFGIIEVEKGIAKSFKEKPRMDGIINGGFFIFSPKIFDYLKEKCILEEEPLKTLAKEGQLAVYEHTDFWMCMDTYKDWERLNKMWETGHMPHMGLEGKPPWKIWC
jgi:glucose-1-phosphate cytidylyltransferase